MARTTEFRLPDLGEGLTDGEIVRWLVAVGDEVRLNQPIVEVETAKAVVEIPSPYVGRVAKLLHAEGDVVDVGAPIISFGDGQVEDQAGGQASNQTNNNANDEAHNGGGPLPEKEKATNGRTPMLVGYGPATGTTRRRARKESPLVAETANAEVRAVLAKPPVRKLARDLGVDLRSIHPTGPHATVSRDDVTRAARNEPSAVSQPSAPKRPPLLTGGLGDRTERIPIRGVRRTTAEAMVASAFTAPHASAVLDVDMTQAMAVLRRLRARPEFSDVKLSPLLLVMKAALVAIKRNPMLNATWDADAQEIVVKHYVNLGIAVASDRGLLVPNIKDAHTLSTYDLAVELNRVVATARSGHATPADMRGGTFSITNIGVFGIDAGTPILPQGEAAILAVGSVKKRPWVCDDQILPREVATLTVSFDHRVVDGEQGAKFLADVGAFLTDPEVALLAWG